MCKQKKCTILKSCAQKYHELCCNKSNNYEQNFVSTAFDGDHLQKLKKGR